MKSIISKVAMPIMVLAMAFSACKKDDTTPTTPTPQDPYKDLYKIAEKEDPAANMSIALYMAEEPYVGYNRVYAVVKNTVTDELITNSDVQFMPMMDMGAMQHSSPYENPIWNAEAKAHKGSITFIMPSMAGTWTVKVMAQDLNGGITGEATFDVQVVEKAESKMYSFVSSGGNKKIFVALLEPQAPTTGMNPFHVAIYKKENMMSFPPVSGLQIEIDPEMPTMGHGSPGNVNPVDAGYGFYHGEVNFTMTGYWKVNIVVKDAQGNVMHDKGAFDITF